MHLTKYRRGYDDSQVTSRRLGGSFTIPEWCEYRRLSISMFYRLRAQGKAPATLSVGRHQTITVEADAAWARERQAETKKTITAEADAAWVRERQAASLPRNPITSDEAS
jgi:hypothetical protein